MKSLSKNTIFIQKKILVTDAVTGKYIEEAQPLKLLQPACQKKINFTPKKSEKNQFWLHKLLASSKGDNYLTKKVKVVSLANDMPTGPNICLSLNTTCDEQYGI